jgi:hypothetical protein
MALPRWARANLRCRIASMLLMDHLNPKATYPRPPIRRTCRRLAISSMDGSASEPLGREPVGSLTHHFWRNDMKNCAIYLAVGASALLVTAASAAPLAADVSGARQSNIQNVRMVCNEGGRCWRERDERRVIIRDPGDSYGYAPRERYIERRGYDDRGGVGFRAPGVSVGIGADRY